MNREHTHVLSLGRGLSLFTRFFVCTCLILASVEARALDTSLTLGLTPGVSLLKYNNGAGGSGTIASAPDLGIAPGLAFATKSQSSAFTLDFPIQRSSLIAPSVATLDASSIMRWGVGIGARTSLFNALELEGAVRYQNDRLVDASAGSAISLVSAGFAQLQSGILLRLVGDFSANGGLGASYTYSKGLGSHAQSTGSGVGVFTYFAGGLKIRKSLRTHVLLNSINTGYGTQAQAQFRLELVFDIPFYLRKAPVHTENP